MEKQNLPEQRLIIALDFPSVQAAETFLALWSADKKPFVKVGMQLFYIGGPAWVTSLVERGYSVFLDLKLHDIPHTVAGGVRSLAQLGVEMITLHAAGGRAMLEAAREAVEPGEGPRLLAVTQLTSTDQQVLNQEIGIPGSVAECVGRYARLSHEAGIDGIVCSGWEVPTVKEWTGDNCFTVTPGIRLTHDATQDQKRVITPEQAITLGADYLVVGRSVTLAVDPLAVYRRIEEQMGMKG